MRRNSRSRTVTRLGATSVLLGSLALSAAWSAEAATEGPRVLSWDDLMPKDWSPPDPFASMSPGQLQALEDGTEEAEKLMREMQEASRSAPVVESLNATEVRIPGYVVPLDFSGQAVSEFLLVPYFGACIHVPPPPSNQIVYVRTATPYKLEQVFDVVWVTGTMSTKAFTNELGDAGYSIEATQVDPYTD
ncbi:MAG: DUF3299 domain-containing protein [Ectothiorhodospiraceae bacterium]|nr:DUF3299 domain-containing protein [Ectothiorhodospiraceae bacterium]